MRRVRAWRLLLQRAASEFTGYASPGRTPPGSRGNEWTVGLILCGSVWDVAGNSATRTAAKKRVAFAKQEVLRKKDAYHHPQPDSSRHRTKHAAQLVVSRLRRRRKCC
jgi:hypothetical protein